MGTVPAGEVTLLLLQARSGDKGAFSRLMELIYPDLRRMARAFLRNEAHARILQPTALVNEAYLRLTADAGQEWQNRSHFFGAAANVMRRVLIDCARANVAGKRRGETVPLDDAFGLTDERSVEALAIDEALSRLAAVSPRQAQVVEMRYFGGLTIEEVAEVLSLTTRTVDRDWRVARAWLRRYLSHER